jgi:hypothetical protein
MTKFQAAIEIAFLTVFFTTIAVICMAGQVTITNGIFTLVLAGLSYIILLFNRQSPLLDRHLKPYFLNR